MNYCSFFIVIMSNFYTSYIIIFIIYINSSCQFSFIRKSSCSGILDCLIDFFSYFLINCLNFFFCRETMVKNHLFHVVNTIMLFSVILNFISRSVRNARIRHGMSMISIGCSFDKYRPIFNSILFAKFQSFSNSKNIGSI